VKGVARNVIARAGFSHWICTVRRFCSLAGLLPVFDPRLRCHGAVLETVGLVARLHNMAMVGQAIQQRRRHLGVHKHTGPFREAQVGRNDYAGVLV
jgi:hypothetical protein